MTRLDIIEPSFIPFVSSLVASYPFACRTTIRMKQASRDVTNFERGTTKEQRISKSFTCTDLVMYIYIASIYPSQAPALHKAGLILDDQTRNTRRTERTQDTRNQSTQRKSGDIARSPGSDLRQDTNLRAQGAQIPKAAQAIRRDELGSGREGGVHGVGTEIVICHKFVLQQESKSVS